MSADSDKLKVTGKTLNDASVNISQAASAVESSLRDLPRDTLLQNRVAFYEEFVVQDLVPSVNELVQFMEKALTSLVEQGEHASDGLTLMARNIELVEDTGIAGIFRDLEKALDRPGENSRD